MSGPYRVESFGQGVMAEWGVQGPVGAQQSPDWSRKDAREMAARHNRIHEAAISVERSRLRERVKERRQTLDMRPPLAKAGYLLALDDVMAMLAEPGEERT